MPFLFFQYQILVNQGKRQIVPLVSERAIDVLLAAFTAVAGRADGFLEQVNEMCIRDRLIMYVTDLQSVVNDNFCKINITEGF